MTKRHRSSQRRLCGATCLLVAACVLPSPSRAGDLPWVQLSGGIRVSVWKAQDQCPIVPRMLVVDLDPERIKFSVHYYAQEGLSEPLKIDQWQKRTGHHLVFNAGLFRENFSYLGLLYKDGRPLGSRRHPSWRGLFVAEPTDSGLRKARVLDLDSEVFDEERPPYREAAQALMLLDRTGKVRVRETGKYAYQTIVAETVAGHVLVFKSLGAARLYDIGQCLKDVFPTVRQAMAMDGGSSSDVRVLESLWQKDMETEDRTSWKSLFGGNTGSHIPLPTVIGASPRY
jgi:uncharacterized protein YigE (DUF2233 family)